MSRQVIGTALGRAGGAEAKSRANPRPRRRAGSFETACGTILVVDDSRDIQSLARVFLEQAGYAVITASDGEEGLRVYEQMQCSIGLLLTDVAMPKMNGLDLADRVLQLDSKLPVLLMSGDAVSSAKSFELLTKPFTPHELIGCVGKALQVSEDRREREQVR